MFTIFDGVIKQAADSFSLLLKTICIPESKTRTHNQPSEQNNSYKMMTGCPDIGTDWQLLCRSRTTLKITTNRTKQKNKTKKNVSIHQPEYVLSFFLSFFLSLFVSIFLSISVYSFSSFSIYLSIYLSLFLLSPASWGCRITLHRCRGVRHAQRVSWTWH